MTRLHFYKGKANCAARVRRSSLSCLTYLLFYQVESRTQTLFRRINRARRTGGGASATLDAFFGINDIHRISFGNGVDRTDGQTGANAVTAVRDEVCQDKSLPFYIFGRDRYLSLYFAIDRAESFSMLATVDLLSEHCSVFSLTKKFPVNPCNPKSQCYNINRKINQ